MKILTLLPLLLALTACGGGTPESPEAALEQGLAAMNSGDLVAADTFLSLAVDHADAPDSVRYQARLERARARARANDLDGCDADIAKLQESASFDVAGVKILAGTLRNSDVDRAIRLLDWGIKQFPDSSEPLLASIEAIQESGEGGDALSALGYVGD